MDFIIVGVFIIGIFIFLGNRLDKKAGQWSGFLGRMLAPILVPILTPIIGIALFLIFIGFCMY